MLRFSSEKQAKPWKVISEHKILSAAIALVLVALIVAAIILAEKVIGGNTPAATLTNSNMTSSQTSETSGIEEVSSNITSSDITSSDIVSSEATSSEETVSSEAPVSSQAPATSSTVSSGSSDPDSPFDTSPVPFPPISGTDYQFNTNLDIEDNVFFDSMIYTGYNIEKHRADGNMWVYILAAQKRGLGYLSNIGYAGGSTGYEMNAEGKPDIKFFERNGLVCASYLTYVYFNYLPNVAGIDTSSLTRPRRPYSANDWYLAAKDWVKKGYSEEIPWTASLTSAGFIKFNTEKEMPIGSIIVFRDARKNLDYSTHVVIYAGYKNGYNWVYHVGNDNGPEFCAVERMHFGPDPQWPLMVISTPSNIRMSASLEVELKDDSGAAVSGAKFSLKENKTGKETALGTTDANGKIVKDKLSYGDHELILTVPEGYTCATPVTKIKLNTLDNSYNKISVTVTKDKLATE